MKKTKNTPFFLLILVVFTFVLFACEEKDELITPTETSNIHSIEETLPLGKVKDITVTLEKEQGTTDTNKRLRFLIKKSKRKPTKHILQKKELGFPQSNNN